MRHRSSVGGTVPVAVSERGERLQKALARNGLGSRRELERWIAAGRIDVDGVTAQLGTRVTGASRIAVDGRPVAVLPARSRVRVLAYHKPVGEVCTRRDPEGRRTVFAHLPAAPDRPWLAVGRLDLNTSGLLLFTNDGELAARLMHPRHGLEREYMVRVRGNVAPETLQRLLAGVALGDGEARFETLTDLGGRGTNHWYRVVLRDGRKREVRRLWESQGVTVSRLKRLRFGSFALPPDIGPGHWRDSLPRRSPPCNASRDLQETGRTAEVPSKLSETSMSS